MILNWKFKRELSRLNVQFQGLFETLYAPILQYRHDRWRHEHLIPIDGDIQENSKIALLLIYQPRDVSNSVYKTCDHFISKGYAPLIISNTPLARDDIGQFKKRCWKLAVRPNLGYDFGGYRDGIWLLNQMGITPKNLLIMNDSVWFPIRSNSTLLDDMENSDADYVGTQVFGRLGNASSHRKWRQPFFGSYCFMIKKNAFRSSAFQEFWEKYRLSSNKEKTLRRGERAFSYAMFASNIKSKGVYSRERFDQLLDTLDNLELRDALSHAVCLTKRLESQRLDAFECFSDTSEWRNLATTVLQATAESKNYIGAAPILSTANLGFPMVKKNNEMLYRRARKQILSGIHLGTIDGLDAQVVKEIEEKVLADQYI